MLFHFNKCVHSLIIFFDINIILVLMSNHSNEEILELLLKNDDIEVGGIYYHYRNPTIYYQVLMIAINEATETPVVVYQALYGKKIIWTRKISIWNQLVEHNGVLVKRFTKKI